MTDSDKRGASYSVPLYVYVRAWLRGEPGASTAWLNEAHKRVAAVVASVQCKINRRVEAEFGEHGSER